MSSSGKKKELNQKSKYLLIEKDLSLWDWQCNPPFSLLLLLSCGGSVNHPETMNGYWGRINKIKPNVWRLDIAPQKKAKDMIDSLISAALRPGWPLGRERTHLSTFWGQTFGPLMDKEVSSSIDRQRPAGMPPFSHRTVRKHILCL